MSLLARRRQGEDPVLAFGVPRTEPSKHVYISQPRSGVFGGSSLVLLSGTCGDAPAIAYRDAIGFRPRSDILAALPARRSGHFGGAARALRAWLMKGSSLRRNALACLVLRSQRSVCGYLMRASPRGRFTHLRRASPRGRWLGHTVYGGADIGEVVTTAQRTEAGARAQLAAGRGYRALPAVPRGLSSHVSQLPGHAPGWASQKGGKVRHMTLVYRSARQVHLKGASSRAQAKSTDSTLTGRRTQMSTYLGWAYYAADSAAQWRRHA